MDSRVVVVPKDSALLRDPGTDILHTYPDGAALVRTTAKTPESGGSEELPVRQGLQLAGVSTDDLTQARETLPPASPPDTETSSGLVTEASIDNRSPILAYIELIGPVDAAWLKALRELNIEPLRYQPENSYLCRGTPAAFQSARAYPFVLHVTPLTSVMKPRIETMAENGEEVLIVVQAWTDETDTVLEELRAIPGVEIDPDPMVEQLDFYLRVRARVTFEGQEALLQHARVVTVERYEHAHPEDEVADLIIAGEYDTVGRPGGSYLHWLENHGLTGEGVTIGIVDNGVDATHPAFAGRINDLGPGRKAWHGTFVAGHAAGRYLQEKDHSQFIYGVGVAPWADILVQDNSGMPSFLCKQTVTEQGPSGIAGSVQNNSWGKGTRNPMDYGSEEAMYDRLVRNADPQGPTPRPLTICFSAGNSGQAGLTRPKSAKNIIVTGNSQNYRPDVGREQSSNIRSIYSGSHASSWGNCGDGRIRPHVVAPGEWTASANYDSHAGDREYISPLLTWGGGTSAASPKTAGACALLIQWWKNHNNGQEPSPALLRALIVNGAEPIDSGGFIPNNIQGWGRLNLDNILDEEVQHVYVDQTILLTRFGEQKEWKIRVFDGQKPVKITLAYTDPPGPPGSGSTPAVSPIVNRLALRVESGGRLYRANQFQQGWSYGDGPADGEGADNLQNVYLAPGEAAETVRVRVTALNITTNCLTGAADTPQQDFALVITNGQLDSATTPADVFVGVDGATRRAPAPDSPDGFWKDTPGEGDTYASGSAVWNSVDRPGNNRPSASTSTVNGSAPSEDDWWNSADIQWSTPETGRETGHEPLAADASFVRGVEAGIELLTASRGHSVIIDSVSTAESSDDGHGAALTSIKGDSPYGTAPGEAVSQGTPDLSATLARLMANWEHLGATPADELDIRRRVAVLVVGAGTRVSQADIDAMRRLTFMGALYLISDNPAVLAFLVQRIHRRQGIYVRVAQRAAELGQLVRDTLAEAGGAQMLGIISTTVFRGQDLHTTALFDVVEADQHVTIRIRYPQEAAVTAVQLQRPDESIIEPGSDAVPASVQLLQRPTTLQIDIAAPSATDSWAGTWTLRLTQRAEHTAQTASVQIWARGGVQLALREQAVSAGESGRESKTTLVVLNGGSDVTFVRSIIPPPRTATGHPQAAAEVERAIIMDIPPSRLARETAAAQVRESATLEAEVTRDQPRSSSLSTWLPVPPAPDGATVVDIPVQVLGFNAHGRRFARLLRSNLIRLEPRTAWRQRLASQKPIALVTAQIAEVHYTGGEIAGLRLSHGNRERNVSIVAPTLRAQLAQFDLDDIKDVHLNFGVQGHELVGIFRLLR